MCKLSVIIPVYNTCAALPRCIESVLGQDFSDFELLLIDDGSTDDSGKVCDAYAEKDSRVKTFHKTRGGPSSARNIGLDNATGEWVTFIDSDDYVDAGYLSLPYSDDVDLYVRNWNFAKSNALEHFDSTFVDNEHYWGFLQERMYGFAFRTACCSFFKRALIEQGRIRFDERFDVNNPAFRFPCCRNGTDLQGFRILPEQFIGHIGNCCLCLQRLLGMMHSQCKYHLALPQRKGVGQCGLDSFNQEAVIILKQPDLRRHLD